MAAFKTAKICYSPTGAAAGTWDTDGTPSTTALANVGYYHLEEIRDYMYSTLYVKPWSGDEYMCLASTKFLRGIKQDPKWEVWNKYTNPEAKAIGEVGKIENIRFVEVGNTDILSGTKGSGSCLGEAVIFGASPVKSAIAIPPHLRLAIPGDFGRKNACAWYGVMNFGLVWDTANAGEANVVRVTSA
jgi:N4-gp56 family major capsid protein